MINKKSERTEKRKDLTEMRVTKRKTPPYKLNPKVAKLYFDRQRQRKVERESERGSE